MRFFNLQVTFLQAFILACNAFIFELQIHLNK